VHVAPSCVGSGEESDDFGSYVHSLSLHLCKRLFLGLEPHGHKATTLPLCQASPSMMLFWLLVGEFFYNYDRHLANGK
jgi:hypothetical protein